MLYDESSIILSNGRNMNFENHMVGMFCIVSILLSTDFLWNSIVNFIGYFLFNVLMINTFSLEDEASSYRTLLSKVFVFACIGTFAHYAHHLTYTEMFI